MANLLKWWQTMRISWSRYTAYRLNFFLQVIGPAIVFFFIKYSLWSAIFSQEPHKVIQGYDFQGMINYHVWTLIVGLVAQGHTAMNLSEDIRLGRISTYLIYPFNFWEFHTASFFSFQILQFCIALISLGILLAIGVISSLTLSTLCIGFLFCFYVSLFWYLLQYLTGILGFWLEETWMLRVILQIVAGFLSGAIIPLELYPQKFVAFLNYTPFPYLTYYPVKVFSGDYSHLMQAFLVIAFWIGITFVLNHLVWKKGIKNYTAAGM
ncbi:ABC-2 family transporter protein [Bacteriovorax sp. BSW11_IV]|uniref:ABC transporter permease n=1 Tax=Bacteriovorax sp. BSW11_IV TaxID=1353529 RepID=UPI000389F47A|nr:ABC-2 family transporter protein [Bacteriovorax sp. BSW11_IV]EQC49225.1 ABC-2 family transporter protein [Bacteriovorax sp. BSW11_IV]